MTTDLCTQVEIRPAGALTGAGATFPLADLLAEPPAPGSERWLEAVTRRLVAADAEARLADDAMENATGQADALQVDRAVAAGWGWPLRGSSALVGLGIGSLWPALIVVGEAPRRAGQLPLHARAGAWLWPALRLLGWDELRVRCLNARRRDGTEDPALRELASHVGMGADGGVPRDCLWLALGKVAARDCRALGILALEVLHPAAARRFRFGDGCGGYARRLEAAGLPRGTWDGTGTQPWPEGEELPTLPSPVGDVPPHIQGRARLRGPESEAAAQRARLLRRRRDLRSALQDTEARLEAAEATGRRKSI